MRFKFFKGDQTVTPVPHGAVVTDETLAGEICRELIANVSHDLRTPLAYMQGYIETLLIKDAVLPENIKQQYLKTAYKHSQRLNNLIAQLFELAKLDSGAMDVNFENFSLTELMHDSVQDFALTISENKIDVSIKSENENGFVYADIALIQGVIQNLLNNAPEHIPKGTFGSNSDSGQQFEGRY